MPCSSASGTHTAERIPWRRLRMPASLRSSMTSGCLLASTQPAMPSPSEMSVLATTSSGSPCATAMRIRRVSGSRIMMLPVCAARELHRVIQRGVQHVVRIEDARQAEHMSRPERARSRPPAAPRAERKRPRQRGAQRRRDGREDRAVRLGLALEVDGGDAAQVRPAERHRVAPPVLVRRYRPAVDSSGPRCAVAVRERRAEQTRWSC